MSLQTLHLAFFCPSALWSLQQTGVPYHPRKAGIVLCNANFLFLSLAQGG